MNLLNNYNKILENSEISNIYSPEDIEKIRKSFKILESIKDSIDENKSNIFISDNNGVPEDCLLRGNIHISEKVKIGRNVRIIGDVYIQDQVRIADDCFIRGKCFLGENSALGKSAEIKDSIILDNSLIGPNSFIGSSIVGSECFLGALVRTSNIRLDRKEIYLKIDQWSLNMGFDFGSLIGSKTAIGVLSSILPGRAIRARTIIPPNTSFSKH